MIAPIDTIDTLDKSTTSSGGMDTSKGAAPISAINKRAAQPLLVDMFAVRNLLAKLPLVFPVDPKLPPSPKARYRSYYCYLGPDNLLKKDERTTLSDLEIALYLIDFSSLRPVLAGSYVQSRKGKTPFDPVSMFLCICLRREAGHTWDNLAKLLAHETHGLGWRRLFGFEDKDGRRETPSASGLRYFFDTVGAEVFDEFCPMFIDLIRQNGFLPERSTFPGDPEERGITITQDGMLHDALSRPSCILAMDSCYQPCTENQDPLPEGSPSENSDQTEEKPNRPCRAKKNGQPRCVCDTADCQERCQKASRLDSEARYIHYEGHNNKNGDTEGNQANEKGRDVFGYRSIADRILDDRFAVAWNAKSSLYSANTDERTVFTARLNDFRQRFPELKIGECLYDSAVGYAPCLEAIWELGALRMVDIRGDSTDKAFDTCVQRGYDGEGYPLCFHGYRLYSNGYDYDHRRRKWVCNQVCRRKPRRKGEPVAAVKDCPFLKEERPLGFIVNVGKTLPGGNIRLAREIPYGSEEWDARYGRRNLSESRNGQLEKLGLKRMKSYGLERNTKEVQVADFLINLRTLGRLVREATKLSEK